METKYNLPFTHTLVCLFGMASWLDINGLWVQLPIMVNYLPEGWALGSYLVLVIQIANIGPITFSIVNKFTSRKIEIPTNYMIISGGMIACVLLAPFWDETTYINGQEHSMALLTLSGLLALVDCTSSVSFLAFMALFPKVFMSSYFVGEGFSAFVPSILGLLQGVGGNPECLNSTFINTTIIGNTTVNTTYYDNEYYYPSPRYSVEVYFILLAVLLLTSLVSFAMLVHLPTMKSLHVKPQTTNGNNGPELTSFKNTLPTEELKQESVMCGTGIKETTMSNVDNTPDSVTKPDNKSEKPPEIDIKTSENLYRDNYNFAEDVPILKQQPATLSRSDYIYLLTWQAWSCALTNGVMPSIQAYSTLPYGNVTYHLVVTLGLMMMPTASLCVHWLPAKTNLAIGILGSMSTLVSAYIFYIALSSPYPPLCGNVWGPILSVTSWLLFYFLFTYVKVSIGARFRVEGRTALIWYGGLTQVGSFCGAIVIFPLVNTLHLFQPNDPCEFTCY
ncbi:solute carrier family 52, riboflavin transporter, member 3-B-like [Glandiceps talaboti]